jgi:transcriptional regulator with XRE-family HTH domain
MDTLSTMPRIYGDRLRRLRKERFLSHRDLAKLAGVSPTTVLNMEQNKGGARASTVRKLAAALDVEPSYLAEQ